MDERINSLRERHPSRGLALRGGEGLAILLAGGADIPYAAFRTKAPSAAVYGPSPDPDYEGTVLLCVLPLERLEEHPRGKGTRLRLYPSAPWVTLTPAQVDRLRELAHGLYAPAGQRSRASALSNAV